MMKNILVLLLCAALSASFCACTEIGVENSNENESAEQSSSVVDSTVSSADTETSEDSNESSNVIIDDSSAPDVTIDNSSTVDVKYTTTDDYSYAVTLSTEELDAINAGSGREFMILVNKENKLSDDYVPQNLVDVRNTRKDRAPGKMVETAEIALYAFLKEAAYYGYGDVTVTSAYRSISYQHSLFYNKYVPQEMAKGLDRESAIAAASKYSAFPGTSEHHTGLCVDMHNLSAASQTFGSTPAAKWLASNAHRFGFILRFPQGKDDITGYMWEPWHFRFVGVHYATEIYESGLCFEEYLAADNEAEVG